MNIDLHGFGPAMMAGTLMTVKLALCALLLGLALGLLGALAKTSSVKPLQWLGGTYSTLVRGVPELLWVLLIYFGTVGLMNSLGAALNIPGLELSAFAAGVIALGLCFGAYATEVFRGAILAIPKGHREAGLALGLPFAEALIGPGDDKQLALPPSRLQDFIRGVRDSFERAALAGEAPVLLTSPGVRPYVRSIIERFRGQTVVMSQNEIHPRARLKTVGMV